MLPRLLLCLALIATAPFAMAETRPVLVVHGGAGTISRAQLTPELRAKYEADLDASLDAGYALLEAGGTAMDAVMAAIVVLEDSPLFNAGRGAVFTHAGHHELDASVMDGATSNAGAVGGVRYVKNPILLARRVMDASPHVMLSGQGAQEFAIEQGLELKAPAYFHTPRRRQQLKDAQARQAAVLDLQYRAGTVGAVALDKVGNLAAGTSTGGMTNKRYGRIGDSPIIGAGTWASNDGCAVSATGHGEYFIRAAVAHDICARVEYGGMSLAEAADHVVMKKLVSMGGDGGVIAVDRQGNVAMPFNSNGMYRGAVRADGSRIVAIHRGDE